LVVCDFSRTIRAYVCLFVVYEVWCLCLACRTLKWVRKYWSARGMSGHTSAGPLRACVKVTDYCDPSSTDTLTCVKPLATMFESVCATVSECFAIADRFLFFW
jgi:hypothetical protein